MKSIIIFADYFGTWPDWFDMYLVSCRCNPTIQWCIHTDCPKPHNLPPNVSVVQTSFDAYCNDVSARLGVSFRPLHPYSICNLKPMYGTIHADRAAGFDYFGWSDIDVIYGDIRALYTDDVLTNNMVSSHAFTCSGHLTLMKNEPWLRDAYQHIAGWRQRLEDPSPCKWRDSLDEAHLTAIFAPTADTRSDFSAMTGTTAPHERYYSGNYFAEQWSTPFTPLPWLDGSHAHPETWYWANGRLTNSSDGERQFLYLHLMNLKAPCWVNEVLYRQAPTWKQLDTCMRFDMKEFHQRPPDSRRVRIDRQGLHLMDV